jgi:hypothetical protein
MASIESTQPLTTHLPRPSSEQVSVLKLFAICLLVPCALISCVLTLSPNFSDSNASAAQVGLREHPFGGHLLQDYVGGYLWNSDRSKLYDWSYSKIIQHDESIVGFNWEPSGIFPMVYPPFHYQFASLSSGLEYRSFVVTWTFAGAIALSLAAFVFLFGFRDLRSHSGGWFFVAILFTPLLVSINGGQKSAILLAILTLTFILLHRERPLTAGLVFGLIAFKPYLAIPIGIVMLCKKQYRFVAGSLVTLFTLMGISWLASPESWFDYIRACFGMSHFISTSGYQLNQSHSLWGAMQLLLGDRAPALAMPLAVVAAIGVLTLLGRIMSGPIKLSSSRFAFQFAACVIATVLISPHFYTYDLTILLLPLAICGLNADITHRINRRVMYWICISVLFGATFYGPIAMNFGFQISTMIFFAWLMVIAGGWNAIDVMREGTLEKAKLN